MPSEMLTVRDLMTTDVVTIGMDQPLKDARRIFNRRRFHHLIVLDKGQPVGVLSDRDLLKHLSPFVGVRFSERPEDGATLNKRIHQMMTRELVFIRPEASGTEAALRMMHHHVSCLPVIDTEKNLVGIITIRDLVRWIVTDQLGVALPL